MYFLFHNRKLCRWLFFFFFQILFITISRFYSIFNLCICLLCELPVLIYTKTEISIRKVSNTTRERRGEQSRRDGKRGKMVVTARSIRKSGGRRMRKRKRRRRKARSTNMQPENIFEVKNTRASARTRGHSLISLVYGVAFCLINTLVVNYLYAECEAVLSDTPLYIPFPSPPSS